MLSAGDSEDKSQNSYDSNVTLPMRTRKTGVWSEDAPKLTKGKIGSNIIEIERFQNEKIKDSDDIPEIPDIDDIQEDPLNFADVKPMTSVDQSTYRELDNQFDNVQSGHMNFGDLGDIDLSLLTNKLYPEKDVQLCMEIWTIDTLFSDLSKST